ncbi:MAG: 5-(carboxyamino)imidazole ribonucleotide synthase [Acidimicrobiia bacterium]|nr:5-(carboxyamino)imidazole ribonucleotide synthase [Acidimicrobiia bacterium]
MRLGILGGGQLGRMMALAARPLDIECLVVEPAPDPPSAPVAEVIAAAYGDPKALAELADRCDVVTVELEGVPVEALEWLAERVAVHPAPEFVAMAQDRLAEKRGLRALGVPTAPFDDEAGLPAIVKTRRGGYDGRGQRLVRTEAERAAAQAELPDPITEGVVTFSRELSVLAARGADGTVRAWPLVANRHVDGILRVSDPGAEVPAALQADAERIVTALLERYGVLGVATVELFDTASGLVANEIAPRVHNSGHWTIEGSVTSQFEQHVRAVCGLPLGDPSPVAHSVMVNLIGTLPDVTAVLAVPGAHLHLFGKSERPNRKIGHITITAPDRATVLERLERVQRLVAG